MQGAIVSILGHPEFNTVLTRSDGWYDIAVNGGGTLTVVVTKPSGSSVNYFPVQRQVPTQWHQYAVVSDIHLTPVDPASNPVFTVGAGGYQVIAGTRLTDPADDGGTKSHTARVFFPAETGATFQYGACTSSSQCTGSNVSCVSGYCVGPANATLTVHATEYTYGPNGPASLPGNLPSSTAYTYAVELNADEADEAGASVEFSAPVYFYMENLLNFPNGAPVPTGSYDRVHGNWVGAPDGQVIEITGTDNCHGSIKCAILATPDGGTAPSLSLQELEWLALTYTTYPVTLWRVPIPHFSGWDMNWPYMLPEDAGGPPPGNGAPPPPPPPFCLGDTPPNSAGGGGGGAGGGDPGPSGGAGGGGPGNMLFTAFECQNSILTAQTPILGTGYGLHYQSERAPGRTPQLQIPLTGGTIPDASQLVSVSVNILIAGVSYDLTYPTASLTTNETLTWPWNRLDAYGNTVQGLVPATVTVSYNYRAEYVAGLPASEVASAFGQYTASDAGYVLTALRAENQIAVSTTFTARIGVQDPEPAGLGGLTVTVNHLYDPDSQTLWGGDGSRRIVTPAALQIDTVPNTVSSTAVGPIAVGSDGTIYFANYVGGPAEIQSLSPAGVVTQIAGYSGSTSGVAAAGTSSLAYNFEGSIQALTISSSGLLYEAGNYVVNVIDPVAKTIQTIAGTGAGGSCTDNANALAGTFDGNLFGLAVAPDGSVLVVDQNCGKLRRIGTNGALTSMTSGTAAEAYTNGTLASNVRLSAPTSVAVAPDGTIYVTDDYSGGGGNDGRLNRINAATGTMSRVAGGIGAGAGVPLSYDGTLASNLPINTTQPIVATAPDGTVYVTSTDGSNRYSYASYVIWRIDTQGIAHLLAGNGNIAALGSTEGDTGAAVNAALYIPNGMNVSPDGSLVFADDGHGGGTSPYRIRRIHSTLPAYTAIASNPEYSNVTTVIPSLDGSELYGFDVNGVHRYTFNGKTGAAILSFFYDSQYRLSYIQDARYGSGASGKTSFSYAGNPVVITAPQGQATNIQLDGSGEGAYPYGPGRATKVTSPQGYYVTFAYGTGNGLVTSIVEPNRSSTHSYVYDGIGQLIQDTDPSGALRLLNRRFLVGDGGALPGLLAGQSWTSAITMGAGDITTHQVQTLSNGSTNDIHLSASGATSSYLHTSADTRVYTAADETVTSISTSPDPQYLMLDPIFSSVTTTLPTNAGVLSSTTTRTRTLDAGSNPLSPSSITDTVVRGATSGVALTRTTLYNSSGAQMGGIEVQTSSAANTGATRSVQRTLDAYGRVTQVQQVQSCTGTTCTPAFVPGSTTMYIAPTSYTYAGPLGKLSQVSIGTGGTARTWTYGFDSAGNVETVTNPVTSEETTYTLYDDDGRVGKVTLPDSNAYSYGYNTNGIVASLTVPKANANLSSTHNFTYDPTNFLASYEPPQVSSADGGVETPLTALNTSYTYDGDHNLLTSVIPVSSNYDTVTRTYDPFSRLSSVYDPLAGYTSTFTYPTSPVTDQIATANTSSGVSVTNTWDGFLKTNTAWSATNFFSAGSVGWSYDALFRPSELTVTTGSAAASITASYADPEGLYVGTTSPSFAVVRDGPTGLVTTATLGYVQEKWTYDIYGAPATYVATNTSSGATIYSMSVTQRDNDGRIQDLTETNYGGAPSGDTYTWSFSYDSRGRLQNVTVDSPVISYTKDYGYDPNGNLTSPSAATYDAQDRLVSMNVNGTTYNETYTNNGELYTITGGSNHYSLEYDLQYNLQAASSTVGGVSSTLVYAVDAMNRRVGKAWTESSEVQEGLLYDEQGRVVAELSGPNDALTLRSTFAYGLKPNVPDYMVATPGGKAYAIISDWRGSVRDVVDSTVTSGGIIQYMDYDEWGNVVRSGDSSCTTTPCLSFQPFGFAGGIYEPSTGLVRFETRDYDPMLKRWTQKDSIRFDGGQTDIYEYAGGDPVNNIDPTGEQYRGSGPPPPPPPIWQCTKWTLEATIARAVCCAWVCGGSYDAGSPDYNACFAECNPTPCPK